MLGALIRSLRPRQWLKNGFVFAALVFDGQLAQPGPFLRTLAGFFVFCLASSSVYLINDLADLQEDRLHPVKKSRPLPSGALPVSVARVAAALLVLVSLSAAVALSTAFAAIVAAYIVSNLLYSWRLKHVPILDVFIVTAGFVLRVAAGTTLIVVERFSPWLYVCMTLLALFLALGKRRAELKLLANSAGQHRRVLDGYTIPLLDQLLVIVSSSTIMAYSLYTFSADNLPANHLMMLTIPFVIYGIFRYVWLAQVQDAGGAPEDLLLTDRPLLAAFLLWGVSATAILYLGT
ncbi:MAG TPA: decaprenyl-phosphate phosphoribosyltransferase [Anaerolineales bacterium]|nr:decaprenyl-phosphate phosphoribosyltransferase [Anaerolineales bacterium]